MCHYNVLKCIRCRQVQPQDYELCENLEHGAICIDERKLISNPSKCRSSEEKVRSTMSKSGTGVDKKSNTFAIDLYQILEHRYIYTDGCLLCSG